MELTGGLTMTNGRSIIELQPVWAIVGLLNKIAVESFRFDSDGYFNIYTGKKQ